MASRLNARLISTAELDGGIPSTWYASRSCLISSSLKCVLRGLLGVEVPVQPLLNPSMIHDAFKDARSRAGPSAADRFSTAMNDARAGSCGGRMMVATERTARQDREGSKDDRQVGPEAAISHFAKREASGSQEPNQPDKHGEFSHTQKHCEPGSVLQPRQ